MLLKLPFVGFLPQNVQVSTQSSSMCDWGSSVCSFLFLSFSLKSHLLSLSLCSCMFNLLRMWTGPPLCLFSLFIFSRLFFSTSLPIFMPVALRQHWFHHTLALLFYPSFPPIWGFPTLSSSLSPLLMKHFRILTLCRWFPFCLSVCLSDAFR